MRARGCAGTRATSTSWAHSGCAGRSWADCSPLFKKIGLARPGEPPARDRRANPRGAAGGSDRSPLPLSKAGRSAGLPVMDDINAADLLGVGYFNFTIKDGRRFSVADGYLRPALSRANLTVVAHAETYRVMVDGGRCTGVLVRHDRELRRVQATAEVILSAGVIGSPRLLLLSGIGPADELQQLGIPVVANLEGVGRNLQDHVLLPGLSTQPRALFRRAQQRGREHVVVEVGSRLTAPDIQPVLVEFPLATPDVAARLPYDRCYTICPSVVRPASRGAVTLASADSAVAPIIDVNFLSSDADMRAMHAAVALCRELGAADAFARFGAREVMPGPLGHVDMADFIRQTASTYFHPDQHLLHGVRPCLVLSIPRSGFTASTGCAWPMRRSCRP